MVWRSMARQAGLGGVSPGPVRLGLLGQARHVQMGRGEVRRDRAGTAWFGVAGRVRVWLDTAGMARHGRVWCGMVRHARHGMARHGTVRPSEQGRPSGKRHDRQQVAKEFH